MLILAQAEIFDQPAPLGYIGFDYRCKLLRRTADSLAPGIEELYFYFRSVNGTDP